MTRVLVVEDERYVRDALSRILSSMNCEVTKAGDGLEAQAELAQTRFDLVVTDLSMPRADGFAVLRYARERRPETPVLIMTGRSTEDCLRAMRAGAFNFLSKPFHPAELREVVRDALVNRTPQFNELEEPLDLELAPAPPAAPPELRVVESERPFARTVSRRALLTLEDGTLHDVELSHADELPFSALLDPNEPFLEARDEGGKPRLYARAAIACISVLPTGAAEAEADAGLPEPTRCAVRVQLRGTRVFEGELRYVAVETRACLSDVLNGPARSFALHTDGLVHHIAKAHVLHVEPR